MSGEDQAKPVAGGWWKNSPLAEQRREQVLWNRVGPRTAEERLQGGNGRGLLLKRESEEVWGCMEFSLWGNYASL